MSKVVVFGTATFSEVAKFYLTKDSDHDVVGFTVHQAHISREDFLGFPVVPFESLERFYPPETHKLFIALGAKGLNRVREKIYHEAKARGYDLITYVSSKCTHWGDTSIGDNCFIFEDNTIQPFVSIGSNTVLWSGNHIGHHVHIGDHCFITSHVVISGHTHIGTHCFIGVNATFRDSITVGKSNVIGAGALIMKSTRDNEVYIPQRTQADSRTSDQLNM